MKTKALDYIKKKVDCGEIRYDKELDLYSATDLLNIINRYRYTHFNISNYLNSKGTKEYIDQLKDNIKCVVKVTRGRGGGTWVSFPLLLDLSYTANSKFKIHDYDWVLSRLINDDSENTLHSLENEFIGAMFNLYPNKSAFNKYIENKLSYIKTSLSIKDESNLNDDEYKKISDFYNDALIISSQVKNTDLIIEVSLSKFI